MIPVAIMSEAPDPLAKAAAYGCTFRSGRRPLHPSKDAAGLREGFCLPLSETGEAGETVIEELIAAAEPGLVGNTDPNFFAWVMGGSHPVGVAADWLTSVWGQNAAIYQTAPAAAIAEEAVSDWLLELLDLPRSASVGLVTGATMASFVGLAAARTALLQRHGHDFEADGLQGAPKIHVFLSDDGHTTNFAAIRMLGLGESNVVRVTSDPLGLMRVEALEAAMAAVSGPKIVIAQAGHINSGGFEDFEAIAALVKAHNGWMHIDGAFGVWARVLTELGTVTRGLDLADSWSVDGHKWLQIPYDLGFAVVRHPEAHRRAMDISASYLNSGPEDGRNPTHFGPELSRRARGFAAWAVMRHLGRAGIAELLRGHCAAARVLEDRLAELPGVAIEGSRVLNQVVLRLPGQEHHIADLVRRLNSEMGFFVRDTEWRGERVLRLSVIAQTQAAAHADALAQAIAQVLRDLEVEAL